MLATLLVALAACGQSSAPAARPRAIVSTVAPARPAARAAERRPRVNFELTEYAGEPPREMPFALDDAAPPPAQVAPHALPAPSPQASFAPQAASQVVVSCPCQTVPAPTVTYAAPAPARPTVRYIEEETYSQPVTYSYSRPVIYESVPMSAPTFSAPTYSAPQSAPTYAARQQSGIPGSYGGGFEGGYFEGGAVAPQAGGGGGGGPPIYIDARQTMEHGPRFGIGAGLFRSGDTRRIGNGRRGGGGGGLFGRRGVSGTAYDGGATSYGAAVVCGPYGCSN